MIAPKQSPASSFDRVGEMLQEMNKHWTYLHTVRGPVICAESLIYPSYTLPFYVIVWLLEAYLSCIEKQSVSKKLIYSLWNRRGLQNSPKEEADWSNAFLIYTTQLGPSPGK